MTDFIIRQLNEAFGFSHFGANAWPGALLHVKDRFRAEAETFAAAEITLPGAAPAEAVPLPARDPPCGAR